MSLPANFSGFPGEDLNHYFRNVCIEFKKLLKTTHSILQIEQEFERFLDTSRQMNWHHKNSGVYHKDAGDKAVAKVISEATRYVHDLQKGISHPASSQDLLDAISEVERLILSQKAT